MDNTELRNTETLDFSLLKVIKAGGYNLYLRHGEKEREQGGILDLKDCKTQSNLTDNGIKQSEKLGEILRNHVQYPIFTNPYCRTKDTGRLAFWEQNIEVMDELAKINNLDIDNPNEQHSLVKEKLIRTFETEPNSQVNRIFIAHEYSFNKCQLFTCSLNVILQNDAP
ncbi:histidine phosphatase family protein [Bacillus wiedmannii]|uniref:histidine phosphatase family protein n=1 Tax=Bacillus wiedmannii TaxID=1890302 RepID=UPI003D20DB89